jgi:cytoskeletal protein RodZ
MKHHVPSCVLPAFPSADEQSIGECFKQARLEKNLTIAEAARATSVSVDNLCALEAMDYNKLPEDAFTKGQIVLYATLLGRDGGLLAEQFFVERDGDKPRIPSLRKSINKQPLRVQTLAQPTHTSLALIAIILLCGIVCSSAGFCLYFSWNPFSFFTDKIFNHSATKTTLLHPVDPATANTLKVQVVFKKDSRVHVSLDNKPSIEQQYTKGASAYWEAAQYIQVDFFQPDSAELLFNGELFPFPEAGDGRYRLRLPAASPR